jgi:hypothetical protein
MTSSIDKVYIHVIDGTDVFIPVDARKVASEQYQLLNDEMYADGDPNCLFEFFVGDMVEVEQHRFADGKYGFVAKKLIQSGDREDRSYWEFKFKATVGQLPIDRHTVQKYKRDIERVKGEINQGQFLYPSLVETLKKLDNVSR